MATTRALQQRRRHPPAAVISAPPPAAVVTSPPPAAVIISPPPAAAAASPPPAFKPKKKKKKHSGKDLGQIKGELQDKLPQPKRPEQLLADLERAKKQTEREMEQLKKKLQLP